jgi:hypothetical protein
MSETSGDRPPETIPDPVSDLIAATPETAYFWGHVAGNGDVRSEQVTLRVGDEHAATVLAAIAGAGRTDRTHRMTATESTHDASITRYRNEFELQVFGTAADRAGAALGLPIDGGPGGYRFDAFSDHRAGLLRGLLEACGTVCFRESSGSIGISFVHSDERLLETVRSLLAGINPHVPTEELAASSSGGYWFGLADDADTGAFARWVYAGSDDSGLYSENRRRKLRRSVERATGGEVGSLSE